MGEIILSIHQPEHLPYIGYINKVMNSDIFVLLDTVQFKKNNYQNRNKMMSNNGAHWLTIPVKLEKHLETTIKDIQIVDGWQKKYLKHIKCNYSKTDYFTEIYPFFENLCNDQESLISSLNSKMLNWILTYLDVKTKIVKSSDLPSFTTKNTALLVDICKHLKATTYISGLGGKDYLDETIFRSNQIDLVFQEFKHPVYKQQKTKEFIPYLSVFDLLFNYGKNSRSIIQDTWKINP